MKGVNVTYWVLVGVVAVGAIGMTLLANKGDHQRAAQVNSLLATVNRQEETITKYDGMLMEAFAREKRGLEREAELRAIVAGMNAKQGAGCITTCQTGAEEARPVPAFPRESQTTGSSSSKP